MAEKNKRCSRCRATKPTSAYHKCPSNGDGLNSACAACINAAKKEAYDRRRDERLRDEFAPLAAEDFAVGVGNVPENPRQAAERGKASEEKRQEYNRKMGETLGAVRDVASGVARELPEEVVEYLAILSEQERRFGNRRIARSTAISLAQEVLKIRWFTKAAETYFANKVQPSGYAARKKPPPEPGALDRTLVVLLSDLHLGARLSEVDNPTPFRVLEESRRLAHVVKQALDYKPQYRDRTRCLVLLIGDVIQGYLQHDIRDGAPLTEQSVIFWKLFQQAGALLSAHFPLVQFRCVGGNHGRNRLRHPGRATSEKWDSFETQLYVGLRCMLSSCPNVRFHIPLPPDAPPVGFVDLYGSTLGYAHGDTEPGPFGNPTTSHDKNVDVLQRFASAGEYARWMPDPARPPAAWAFGHYHTPMLAPGSPTVVYNGMLVPPDGHARSRGYVGKPTGQWLWEAVPNYPVGDARYVLVGTEQDRDESLDRILVPPRLDVGGD